MQRLQRLTAEAGEWARDYRARQRAAAANQPPATPQQPQANALRTVAETHQDAPVAALAAYTQSGDPQAPFAALSQLANLTWPSYYTDTWHNLCIHRISVSCCCHAHCNTVVS